MSQKSIRPSWQNRLISLIRASSVPDAILYALIFIIAALLIHLVLWFQGTFPWGQLDYNRFNFLVWYLFVLFSFEYILSYAEQAVHRFKPIVEMSDEEFEDLSQHFTTISAVEGWIITAIALVFSILAYDQMFPWDNNQYGVLRVVTVIVSTILLSFAFTLIYLMFNQEVTITRLYKRVTEINIFQLGALNVFSGMSVRIATFAVLAGVLAYLTNVVFVTTEVQNQNFAFFGTAFFGLALAAFFLPTFGIHSRLQEEKERARRENDERINRVFVALHQHVDGTKTSELDELKEQLSALLTFRTEIAKIHTWPWNPEALRGFLSTLLLPLIIWLAQRLLTSFFDF